MALDTPEYWNPQNYVNLNQDGHVGSGNLNDNILELRHDLAISSNSDEFIIDWQRYNGNGGESLKIKSSKFSVTTADGQPVTDYNDTLAYSASGFGGIGFPLSDQDINNKFLIFLRADLGQPSLLLQLHDFDVIDPLSTYQANMTALNSSDDYDVATFENSTNDGVAIWRRTNAENSNHYDIICRFFMVIYSEQPDIFFTSDEVTLLADIPEWIHGLAAITQNDRIIVSYLKGGGGPPDSLKIGMWSLDSNLPTIQTQQVSQHAVLWDTLTTKVTLQSNVTDVGARINSGIDTTYFHEHWYWNFGGLVGIGDEIDAVTYAEGNTFRGTITKSQLRQATRGRFYVEAVDRAFNRIWDIVDPGIPNNWWPFYVSRRGDIDVDGYISDNDADILCWHLEYPLIYPLRDWEAVFADWDGDGVLEWEDYYAIRDTLEVPYPYRPSIPLGDMQNQIEMGVGHGAAGSTDNIVPVYIANDSTYIGTVTYTMEYDEGVLTLDQKVTTGRTQYFTTSSPCDDFVHHVGLYGGDSYFISPGNGPVTNLSFSVDPNAPQGSYHITLARGDLADTSGVAVPHLKMRGKFFVGDPPPVSIVCSPLSDTTFERGDTLTFHTVLTNHSWQGFTASVFMYGMVTPDSMNPFLVVDTSYVYLPPNARIASLTELEAPQYAPLTHYEFTGYVGQAQTIYDSDKFGFDIVDSLGISQGGEQLMSQVNAWKLLSGWFGSKARAEEEETTSPSLPKVFSLSQNYPNPFNPMTTIQYSIPEGISNREMKLAIFNVRGQVVRSIDLGNKMEPGVYMYTWEGRDDRGGLVPSGIYFYMLTSEEKSLTRRMLLLR